MSDYLLSLSKKCLAMKVSSKNSGPLMLFEAILWHLNFFLLSVAMNAWHGKDGNGLKLLMPCLQQLPKTIMDIAFL